MKVKTRLWNENGPKRLRLRSSESAESNQSQKRFPTIGKRMQSTDFLTSRIDYDIQNKTFCATNSLQRVHTMIAQMMLVWIKERTLADRWWVLTLKVYREILHLWVQLTFNLSKIVSINLQQDIILQNSDKKLTEFVIWHI